MNTWWDEAPRFGRQANSFDRQRKRERRQRSTSWREVALFAPVERKLLVPQLVDQLRRQISLGALGEYEQLPPIWRLARLFGVSVGTMHKALHVLDYLGVVRIQHGTGTFVVHGRESHRATVVAVRRASTSELRSLRRSLEVEAARRAGRRTPYGNRADGDDDLTAALVDLRASARQFPDEYLASELRFHRALLVRSGDSLALSLHDVTSRRLDRALATDAARRADDPLLVDLHRQLYEAIEARRPAKAGRLCERIAAAEGLAAPRTLP